MCGNWHFPQNHDRLLQRAQGPQNPSLRGCCYVSQSACQWLARAVIVQAESQGKGWDGRRRTLQQCPTSWITCQPQPSSPADLLAVFGIDVYVSTLKIEVVFFPAEPKRAPAASCSCPGLELMLCPIPGGSTAVWWSGSLPVLLGVTPQFITDTLLLK